MTELTEQEREEAFITLALSQKNAELYRRYGAMSPDELDKTGIPDLRRKMWEMTSRLIFAGLLDKECCVPFEKTPPDDYFSNRVVDGGPECGFTGSAKLSRLPRLPLLAFGKPCHFRRLPLLAAATQRLETQEAEKERLDLCLNARALGFARTCDVENDAVLPAPPA